MISILIPTFNRSDLLVHGLASLERQCADYEVLILDESHQPDSEVMRIAADHTYIHTGATKEKEHWRIPGFALNIGFRQAKGDTIIITCPEVVHFGESIKELGTAKSGIMTYPAMARDDVKNVINPKTASISDFCKCALLSAKLPFSMGFCRDDIIKIGGYDEDFTGVCYDDNDFIERLLSYGCKHRPVKCAVLHLYHPRGNAKGSDTRKRAEYNKKLYLSRRGIVQRNEKRDWGSLDVTV